MWYRLSFFTIPLFINSNLKLKTLQIQNAKQEREDQEKKTEKKRSAKDETNHKDCTSGHCTHDTLVLVQTLIRHGDRTVDKSWIYPNDPHINYDYAPFGLAQLTTLGKARAYKAGLELRRFYGHFIGRHPKVVKAVCTHLDRSQTSLQLFLAGLFPPYEPLIWNNELPWQPVAYSVIPHSEDTMFFGHQTVPGYCHMYEKAVNLPEVREELNKHRVCFRKLSEATGLNVRDFNDVFRLYFVLSIQHELGLDIPCWAKEWGPVIKQFTIQQYFVNTATPDTRKVNAGGFLRLIMENAKAKMNGDPSFKDTKMVLYGGHEINIAHTMICLGIFRELHIPPYCSYLSFELHKINNVYGFKIHYQNYTSEYPKLIQIPGYGDFCPADKFFEIIKPYLPTDW